LGGKGNNREKRQDKRKLKRKLIVTPKKLATGRSWFEKPLKGVRTTPAVRADETAMVEMRKSPKKKPGIIETRRESGFHKCEVEYFHRKGKPVVPIRGGQ